MSYKEKPQLKLYKFQNNSFVYFASRPMGSAEKPVWPLANRTPSARDPKRPSGSFSAPRLLRWAGLRILAEDKFFLRRKNPASPSETAQRAAPRSEPKGCGLRGFFRRRKKFGFLLISDCQTSRGFFWQASRTGVFCPGCALPVGAIRRSSRPSAGTL